MVDPLPSELRVAPGLGTAGGAEICPSKVGPTEVLLASRPDARGHRISNREAFSEALTQVNALVRREDLSIPEAKDALTKAEALRAWASFDKRLSDDERKEANRAMTRTILLVASIAEREQPTANKKAGRGRQEGPVVWLRRECGMTSAKASFARRLFHNEERVREILDLGVHWLTGIGNGESRGEVKNTILNRMRTWVGVNNSLWVAAKIAPNMLTRELSRIRNIKAWCEAYEAALLQKQARSKLDKEQAANSASEAKPIS